MNFSTLAAEMVDDILADYSPPIVGEPAVVWPCDGSRPPDGSLSTDKLFLGQVTSDLIGHNTHWKDTLAVGNKLVIQDLPSIVQQVDEVISDISCDVIPGYSRSYGYVSYAIFDSLWPTLAAQSFIEALVQGIVASTEAYLNDMTISSILLAENSDFTGQVGTSFPGGPLSLPKFTIHDIFFPAGSGGLSEETFFANDITVNYRPAESQQMRRAVFEAVKYYLRDYLSNWSAVISINGGSCEWSVMSFVNYTSPMLEKLTVANRQGGSIFLMDDLPDGDYTDKVFYTPLGFKGNILLARGNELKLDVIDDVSDEYLIGSQGSILNEEKQLIPGPFENFVFNGVSLADGVGWSKSAQEISEDLSAAYISLGGNAEILGWQAFSSSLGKALEKFYTTWTQQTVLSTTSPASGVCALEDTVNSPTGGVLGVIPSLYLT